jgi:integrase/recombinase XerC
MSDIEQLPALPTPQNNMALAPAIELRITLPTLILQAGPRVTERVVTFFAVEINNPHTRRAYVRATLGFYAWMERRGLALETIRPLDVAAWMQALKEEGLAVTSIKQQLAAVRILGDYLVRGGVLEANAAANLRGPEGSIRHGKTPMLNAVEANQLLASIPDDRISNLRDRAFIALMIFTFAGIDAALSRQVRDVFRRGKQLWIRLPEKNGNLRNVPCNHQLARDLTAYMQADGFRGSSTSPLFRTVARKATRLSSQPLPQSDAWEVVRRRARAAGVSVEICNQTFRFTRNALEQASNNPGPADPKTWLHERRSDGNAQADVERFRLE